MSDMTPVKLFTVHGILMNRLTAHIYPMSACHHDLMRGIFSLNTVVGKCNTPTEQREHSSCNADLAGNIGLLLPLQETPNNRSWCGGDIINGRNSLTAVETLKRQANCFY